MVYGKQSKSCLLQYIQQVLDRNNFISKGVANGYGIDRLYTI